MLTPIGRVAIAVTALASLAITLVALLLPYQPVPVSTRVYYQTAADGSCVERCVLKTYKSGQITIDKDPVANSHTTTDGRHFVIVLGRRSGKLVWHSESEETAEQVEHLLQKNPVGR